MRRAPTRRASIRGAAPRARIAADLAGLLGLLHSAATIYWACGGTWLLSTLGARILHAFAGRLWLLWPGALIKLLLASVPALLIRHRWLAPRALWALIWAASAILIAWGGVNTLVGNLVLASVIRPQAGYDRAAMVGHAWLWDPLFLAWGIALLVMLRAQRHAPRR